MKELTVQEFEKLKKEDKDFQLIDVRQPEEYEKSNLNGELIPLATIPQNIDKVSKDKKVIVHCRSGKRSANAIQFLEQKGYVNLYNLKGGIIAWKDEIDPSIEV